MTFLTGMETEAYERTRQNETNVYDLPNRDGNVLPSSSLSFSAVVHDLPNRDGNHLATLRPGW